jgi:peptidyl-prolyl cis-trans isomerase SurA
VVERDYRAVLARETYTNNLKKQYGFKEYPENFKKLSIMIPESAMQNGAFENIRKDNSPLFVLQGKTYTAADFGNYAASMTGNRISGPKLSVLDNLYKMYTEKELYGIEEKQLDTKYPEFKALMKEYRDGIMLFELMDRNVWSKASKDSVGLEKYYESHKDKYMWGPSVTGELYKVKNQKAADALVKALKKKNATPESAMKEVNTEKEPELVTVETGRFLLERFNDAFKAQMSNGNITKPAANDDGSFSVMKVNNLYKDPTAKTLAEARGFVIADYQEFLDKSWNDSLKAEYPVTINQSVLQSIIH